MIMTVHHTKAISDLAGNRMQLNWWIFLPIIHNLDLRPETGVPVYFGNTKGDIELGISSGVQISIFVLS